MTDATGLEDSASEAIILRMIAQDFGVDFQPLHGGIYEGALDDDQLDQDAPYGFENDEYTEQPSNTAIQHSSGQAAPVSPRATVSTPENTLADQYPSSPEGQSLSRFVGEDQDNDEDTQSAIHKNSIPSHRWSPESPGTVNPSGLMATRMLSRTGEPSPSKQCRLGSLDFNGDDNSISPITWYIDPSLSTTYESPTSGHPLGSTSGDIINSLDSDHWTPYRNYISTFQSASTCGRSREHHQIAYPRTTECINQLIFQRLPFLI